jgi:arsenate reductase (thioredoxin)
MTVERQFHVLFLCTHNSARSIIAECVLNRLGQGRFKAYSAGSMPSGKVNPIGLAMLKSLNYDTAQLRSKSWGEFETPAAPKLDFIFTVCDSAAEEVCPVWPGHPVSAHWGIPDPSAAEGTDAEKHLAFADAHRMLAQRIGIFVDLPFASLDNQALRKRVQDIGDDATAAETSGP